VTRQLERLGLDHVADPAALTDDEVFSLTHYPRIEPRLRALLAKCHARGVEAVRDCPPVAYKDKPHLVDDDLAILIGAGLTPYTVHRREAFGLNQAISDAWLIFEAVRPSTVGTDIDLPSLPTDPNYWEHIASQLWIVGSTGGNPSAEVRRAVCGMDMTEHMAKKMLLPLARSITAVWAAHTARQAAISCQACPKSDDNVIAFLRAATRDADEARRQLREHDAADATSPSEENPGILALLRCLLLLHPSAVRLSRPHARANLCNRSCGEVFRRHGLYRTRRPARAPPRKDLGQYPERRG
jgi:hypothetical protein